MAKTQFYGIKYPFTDDNTESVYMDLNDTYEASIESQILHIIFTPKGQRLRDPEFGSDLVKYIFEPNDGTSLEGIKAQIRNDVGVRIPSVSLDDIVILDGDDGHTRIVSVYYTVKKGNMEIQNNVAVKI